MPYSPAPGGNPYAKDPEQFLQEMLAKQAMERSRQPVPIGQQPPQPGGMSFSDVNGLLNMIPSSGGQVGGGGLSSAGRASAFTGMGGQVGGGGLSSAGRAASLTGEGAGASSYFWPALAMAGLVKGGNKLNIGLGNQKKWYGRMISDSNEQKLEKLLPWKWF